MLAKNPLDQPFGNTVRTVVTDDREVVVAMEEVPSLALQADPNAENSTVLLEFQMKWLVPKKDTTGIRVQK